MKVDPITSVKPTNADLGRGFNQLHRCFEDMKEQHGEDLAELKGRLAAVYEALGLGESKPKTIAAQSPWSAFRRSVLATTTSVTAIGIVYKVALVLWPSFHSGLLALLHAFERGLI